MVPGVLSRETLPLFSEDDYVSVYVIGKESAFCVAKAIMASSQIAVEDKGRAFVTIHYLGDPLWKL